VNSLSNYTCSEVTVVYLMVSIMVNKYAYKPSAKLFSDIIDQYYEMFRDKNQVNKTDFFNSPEDVKDSDTDVSSLTHHFQLDLVRFYVR
jgi:hypothetical protein